MGAQLRRVLRVLPGMRTSLPAMSARGGDLPAQRAAPRLALPVAGPFQASQLRVHGIWLGVALMMAGVAFWAGRHTGQAAQPAAQTAQTVAPQARVAHGFQATAPAQADSGILYVRRGGSVIRDRPKASGHVLKKESKGATVRLLSEGRDWTKVTDGNITGWMRSSVLRPDPPPR